MDTNLDLIEKYVRGLCSDAEKKKVKHLKQTDSAFAEELRLYSVLLASTAINERERQRENLLAFRDSMDDPIPFYKRRESFFLVAAVFLILLITTVVNLQLFSDKGGPENNLVATYFENTPDTEKEIFRGTRGTVERDQLVEKIVHFQQQKECDSMKTNLATLIELTNDESDMLFLGICYLENKKFDEALEVFGNLQGLDPIRDPVIWYSTIAYLIKGDHKAARDMLCVYIHEEHEAKKDEALEIIESLNVKCK